LHKPHFLPKTENRKQKTLQDMFTFGWFSSGRDQAAIDLFTATLDHLEQGLIKARLAYVFCDRAPGETPASDLFQAAVRGRGISLVTHSSAALRALIRQGGPGVEEAREAFDVQVIELLKKYPAEMVILAGYRLLISPLLSRTFLGLNLHPSIPGGPQGPWQEVIWQLMADCAREAGAMMHVATPERNAGPPVTYVRFPLTGPAFAPLWEQLLQKKQTLSLADIRAREGEAEPLFAKIRAEELRREFPLMLLTLQAITERSVRLTPAGVKVQGCLFPRGLDFTGQVNNLLKGT
jgi:phosphoribosylglycinamide formyltransferase 1